MTPKEFQTNKQTNLKQLSQLSKNDDHVDKSFIEPENKRNRKRNIFERKIFFQTCHSTNEEKNSPKDKTGTFFKNVAAASTSNVFCLMQRFFSLGAKKSCQRCF